MCADVVVDLVEDAVVSVQGGQATTQVAPLLTPAAAAGPTHKQAVSQLRHKFVIPAKDIKIMHPGVLAAVADIIRCWRADESSPPLPCAHLYQGIFSFESLGPWWCR